MDSTRTLFSARLRHRHSYPPKLRSSSPCWTLTGNTRSADSKAWRVDRGNLEWINIKLVIAEREGGGGEIIEFKIIECLRHRGSRTSSTHLVNRVLFRRLLGKAFGQMLVMSRAPNKFVYERLGRRGPLCLIRNNFISEGLGRTKTAIVNGILTGRMSISFRSADMDEHEKNLMTGTLEQRKEAFKEDEELMRETTKFITDVIETAATEASKRKVQSEVMNSRTSSNRRVSRWASKTNALLTRH